MAVPDYDSAVVDALWALLEADADVTRIVLDGNRKPMSMDAGWLHNYYVGRITADFPLVKIELGDFAYGAFTQDPTFGTETTAFNPATARWPMPHDTDVLITTVTRTLKLNEQSELEAAIVKAILKAGPHLGLAYVDSYAIRGRRQVTQRDEAKGTLRRKTVMRLGVRMEFQGADFIA